MGGDGGRGGGSAVMRSKSFAFRAPQKNFTINDFELGKIYGVGSYSKVQPFCPVLIFVFFFRSFSHTLFGRVDHVIYLFYLLLLLLLLLFHLLP